jgi:outer membrane protein OmpA-like peptidoglycan-associated protein
MTSRVSLNWVLFALVATGAASFGTACSHQQKIARSVVPAPPRLAEAHSLSAPVAPEPAPQMATKDKERAIFFDFDSALLRDDARPVLQKVASDVRGKDKEALEVDGNCDELGTVEYNLALGDHRARAAKEYLVHLGVPSDRIKTVSYGSQRPKFAGHDDDARAKNRRDDLVLR